MRSRLHLGAHEQYLVLSFLQFQDDLLEIAVCTDAQRLVEDVESQFICGEPEVELSAIPEANLPFSTTFKFIGAEFITTNPAAIIRRPAKHVRDDDIKWILDNARKLMPYTRLQVAIGHVTF